MDVVRGVEGGCERQVQRRRKRRRGAEQELSAAGGSKSARCSMRGGHEVVG